MEQSCYPFCTILPLTVLFCFPFLLIPPLSWDPFCSPQPHCHLLRCKLAFQGDTLCKMHNTVDLKRAEAQCECRWGGGGGGELESF